MKNAVILARVHTHTHTSILNNIKKRGEDNV